MQSNTMQARKQGQKYSQTKILIIGIVAVTIVAIGGFAALLVHKPNSNPNLGDMNSSGNAMTGLNGTPSAGGGAPTSCMGSACGSGPQTQSGYGTTLFTGKVTAVNGSSITVQPSSGSAKTFSITSSTKSVTVDPAKGTNNASSTVYKVGDVKVGDTIGILPSTSDASTADSILLNMQLQTKDKNN